MKKRRLPHAIVVRAGRNPHAFHNNATNRGVVTIGLPEIQTGLVQIAGVRDGVEASLLCECGVQWLGFPLRLAVHDPDLSEEQAGRIIRRLTPPHFGVLITYLQKAHQIVALSDALAAPIVQIHGSVSVGELKALRKQRPRLKILKSLVVGLGPVEDLMSLVEETSGWVDAYITDTYDPLSGATGATGKTHDWSISRRLVELSPKPVILAGGLTPDNVGQAILQVRPAGVDAHTGVEDGRGRKSRRSVVRFLREAEAAFQRIETSV